MTDTRVRVANCGHEIKPDGISTGFGETREGYILCLECCGLDEIARLPFAPDPYVAYLASDNRTITGWPGNPLMKVTGLSESKAAHKVYVRAVDATGVAWFGVGPNESGNYVTMRRYKDMGGRG